MVTTLVKREHVVSTLMSGVVVESVEGIPGNAIRALNELDTCGSKAKEVLKKYFKEKNWPEKYREYVTLSKIQYYDKESDSYRPAIILKFNDMSVLTLGQSDYAKQVKFTPHIPKGTKLGKQFENEFKTPSGLFLCQEDIDAICALIMKEVFGENKARSDFYIRVWPNMTQS